MDYKRLHSWKVAIAEAVKIQEKLRRRIILRHNRVPIKKIAAVDVAFSDHRAKSAVCVFSFPGLRLIELETAEEKITFPYVPGLLTFREGPVILKAFKKLRNKPQVILFDGQGICHFRRMGIATHLGILLDTPTIGCAKSHLYGSYKMPAKERGSYSFIRDKNTDECLGVVLRTRTGIKPVFISCGHKITLKQAKRLILKLSPNFRIAEPLRLAHRLAKHGAI